MQPAFKKLGFSASERPSVGETFAAIVARENDDRVLRRARRVERPQHTANLQIHLLNHFLVGTLTAAVIMEQAFEAPRLGFVFRPLPRPMRRSEMQADEKRPAVFDTGLDEID